MRFLITLFFSLCLNLVGQTNDFSVVSETEYTGAQSKEDELYLVVPHNKGVIKNLLNKEDAYYCDNLNIVVVKKAENLNKIKNEIVSYEVSSKISIDSVPNDPLYTSQWGLYKINSDLAWNISTGNNVIVAVLDTGADYTHFDLVNNLWIGPNGERGFKSELGVLSPSAQDDHGHGTHVAGIIGASSNNGIGVAGINWDVTILPLKFLTKRGLGELGDAIILIDKAISLKKEGLDIRLMNHSWGGGGDSTALKMAFDALESEDVLNVCAAGNSYDNIDIEDTLPSGFNNKNIITVLASDESDFKANFSNYGHAGTDISAPGFKIESTAPVSTNMALGSVTGYLSLSGTSMAAPHVSGVAALLFSVNPNLSQYQVRDIILSPESYDYVGHPSSTGGRLNSFKALSNLKTNGTFVLNNFPVISSTSPNDTSLLGGESFTLSLEASDIDGDVLNKNIQRNSIITSGWAIAQVLMRDIGNVSYGGTSQMPKTVRNMTLEYIATAIDERGGSDIKKSYVNLLKTLNFNNKPPVITLSLNSNTLTNGQEAYINVNIDDSNNDGFWGISYIETYGGATRIWSTAIVSNNFNYKIPTSVYNYPYAGSFRVVIVDRAYNLVESEKIVYSVGDIDRKPPLLLYTINTTNAYAPATFEIDASISTSDSDYPIWEWGLSVFGYADLRPNQSGKFVFTINKPGIYTGHLRAYSGFTPVLIDIRQIYLNVMNPDGQIEFINNPGDFYASAKSHDSILLSWIDTSDNEAGFILERSADGNSYSFLANLPVNSISYTDAGLIDDKQYYYRLKAYSQNTESDYVYASAKTFIKTELNKVTDLTGGIANGTVYLGWTDNSKNEEFYEVRAYRLASNGAISFLFSEKIPANSNSYIKLLPRRKFTYIFYVRSSAGGLYSENSNQVISKYQ